MISITTLGYNENGFVIIEDNFQSKIAEISARRTRIPTLDGGAVFVDAGFSEADRTFIIKGDIDADQKESIEQIFSSEEYVEVTCIEGVFLGKISDVTYDNYELELTFLVSEKVV